MSAASDIAIQVDHVSKRFKLYHNPVTGPMKELFFPWRRARYYDEFRAVKDVSLTLRRGEVVGVVGSNGAGKTTLLKMISGLLPVNEGTIQVNGKVTALMALGVGVHPEFTGRENILYGGMLLGMSKREVLGKMEDIVEFAELGRYIDWPFRTYSSGMKARLMFATAMSIDPDILIVDEALSTGDSYFVQKSAGRIHELCQSGATILFVSHNLRQVESLCSRGVVLEHGEVAFDGDPTDAVSRHIQSVFRDASWEVAKENIDLGGQVPLHGTGEVLVKDAYWRRDGERTEQLTIGEPHELVIEYVAAADVAGARALIQVRTDKTAIGYAILPSTIEEMLGEPKAAEPFPLSKGQGRVILTFDPLVIGDGEYYCDLSLYPALSWRELTPERSFCVYKRLFDFRADYAAAEPRDRGALAEMPVDAVSVAPR